MSFLRGVVAEVQPIAGSRVDDRKPQRLSRRKIMSRKVLGLLVVVVLIVIVLFATGFWSADVKEGAMPDVDVSAEGGKLPGVDMDSKEVVVGTTKPRSTFRRSRPRSRPSMSRLLE
jgi:hypothetical protein